ncbi:MULTISPECIES: caspase family protein [unclassified Ruegeria]|uniref:caspase family protein n=1 Tax=unclassified Ruegeria TaxID=2625375 RepID=UPI001487785A|nr:MULTISPECIES: caspase family protein [unclassified Ruegeria]
MSLIRYRHVVLLVAAITYWITTAASGRSETDRVALVIGNGRYNHVTDLPNSLNDAQDLASALSRIGFDVEYNLDLDFRGMRVALRDFAKRAEKAEVVLLYFAGHGLEIDNVNYLIPVNAELQSDVDVSFEAIRLDTVVASLSSSEGLKIVLVDACRNNPFLNTMNRTNKTRSIGRGLSRIDPSGVVVSYAAKGGTLALDGSGRNSPYAEALLQHIEEPGLELGKLFRKVRDTVFETTSGYQEPFTYGSLPSEDIFLVPAVASKQIFDSLAQAFAKADGEGSLQGWNTFLEHFANEAAHPLYELGLSRRTALLHHNEKQMAVPESPKSDELALFSAAESLDSPRAWALFFEHYPVGKMAKSARLQENLSFLNALRDRVWGRYRSSNVGTSITSEMRQTAMAMIKLDERQITQIQNALAYGRIGFVGIDGKFGPKTRKGIEKFQENRSLPTTGLPTRATLFALNQTGGWGSSGRLEYDASIYPTSGPLARILDPQAVALLEEDPRLDQVLSVFLGQEIIYGYFENRLYVATSLGTTIGPSELRVLEEKTNGVLVEIDSQEEEDFIRELVRFDQKLWGATSIRNNQGPAIGLRQLQGRWFWRSGRKLEFENWAPGHPQKLRESSPLDESYGRLVPLEKAGEKKPE